MLLAGLASTALVFGLGRRIGLSRVGSIAAAAIFGLSPLAVLYGRWTFLDNLVTPWLLASFILALSRRRSIAAGAGAALCFAMAALTKETTLILLPAFVWALWRNTDKRNRPQVLTVAAGAGGLLMLMYPLLALYKGELFEGEGHNSLLGKAAWQLSGRDSTGSLLDADSPMRHMVEGWLTQDGFLLIGGLLGMVAAALTPRMRPIALALAMGWLLMLRGGYVPFMHVITLLPWSALLIVAAVESLAGRWAAVDGAGRHSYRPRWRVVVAAAVGACLALGLAAAWPPRLKPMMTTSQVQPMRAAELRVGDNVPRDKVLVVHDSIWVDLVHRYGFKPWPVMVQKLDTDPAVREMLERIDYLVLPNWYYQASAAGQAYPTLLEARKHAVAVAVFGSGDDGVVVYRVSAYWRPS